MCQPHWPGLQPDSAHKVLESTEAYFAECDSEQSVLSKHAQAKQYDKKQMRLHFRHKFALPAQSLVELYTHAAMLMSVRWRGLDSWGGTDCTGHEGSVTTVFKGYVSVSTLEQIHKSRNTPSLATASDLRDV